MLRTGGTTSQEIWDVTNPGAPELVTTVVGGLKDTHKNWWECDTGIAYLISDGRPEKWRTKRMTKIYDLSDPAHPKFIRNFALVGQQPGSAGENVPEDTHGPIVLGNRVYFGYGTLLSGVIQIVDRDKLLKGNPASSDPFAPTAENLLYPQISRLDMYPTVGAHTTYPIMGMDVPAFEKFHTKTGDFRSGKPAKRDFLLVVNESTQNECHEDYHMMFMVDITDETKPYSVSNFYVPEKSGNFCARGGRFGTHSSHEDMGPIYYKKLVFISWFNAGLRVVDIRDPFTPTRGRLLHSRDHQEYGAALLEGSTVWTAARSRSRPTMSEVDDRGYIYTCRPRQHRHAHPRANGAGAQDREPEVGARQKQKGRDQGRALFSVPATDAYLPSPRRLATSGIGLGALFHERVHALDADVDQFEAALGRQLLHLGIVVQRRPQFRHALALLRASSISARRCRG